MDTEKQKEFLGLLEPCRPALMAYLRHQLWQKNSAARPSGRGSSHYGGAAGGLEDALQSVLLTACQKFDEFEKGTDFRAWVFQIATYTVFNINRRVEKELMTSRPLPDDLAAPHADELVRGEDIKWLESFKNSGSYRKFLQQSGILLEKMGEDIKEAVLGLNQTERSVFLLRSVGEFSYEEIAGILSIPPGSVMGNLSRARAKLRNKLLAYAKENGWL